MVCREDIFGRINQLKRDVIAACRAEVTVHKHIWQDRKGNLTELGIAYNAATNELGPSASRTVRSCAHAWKTLVDVLSILRIFWRTSRLPSRTTQPLSVSLLVNALIGGEG